jgi:hypothetical protein
VQREIEATREADALRIRVYKLEQQLDLAGGGSGKAHPAGTRGGRRRYVCAMCVVGILFVGYKPHIHECKSILRHACVCACSVLCVCACSVLCVSCLWPCGSISPSSPGPMSTQCFFFWGGGGGVQIAEDSCVGILALQAVRVWAICTGLQLFVRGCLHLSRVCCWLVLCVAVLVGRVCACLCRFGWVPCSPL